MVLHCPRCGEARVHFIIRRPQPGVYDHFCSRCKHINLTERFHPRRYGYTCADGERHPRGRDV